MTYNKSLKHTSKNFDKPLVIGFGLVALFAMIAGIIYLRATKQPSAPVSERPQLTTIIARVQAAEAVDAAGNPVQPATTFPAKSKKVYVTVSLAAAKKNDTVSYIRYKDGKFVNAGTVRVASKQTKNIEFAFQNKKGYPPGQYKIDVYQGQKKAQTVAFNVK